MKSADRENNTMRKFPGLQYPQKIKEQLFFYCACVVFNDEDLFRLP